MRLFSDGRGGPVGDGAESLLGMLMGAMRRAERPGTWFRGHPRALTPEFGAFLESYIERTTGGWTDRQRSSELPLALQTAQFALRVQHECGRHGTAAALERLQTGASAVSEIKALVRELDGVLADLDQTDGDAMRHAALRFEALVDHPGLVLVADPGHSKMLVWTSRILRAIFPRAASQQLLDLRLRAAEVALAVPPLDPAVHAALLDQLAFAKADACEHSGETEFMREALRLHEESLSLTPDDDALRADRLNSLGACHRDLYLKAGQADALDAAIALFERSVAIRPETVSLNNVAVSLFDRFRRDDRSADLDRAITLFEVIAVESADDDEQLPRSLTDFAGSLLARYRRAQAAADLERAVGLCERALALRPAGSVLAASVTTYADALIERAIRDRDRAQFDRALVLFDQVRSALPEDSALADQAAANRVIAVMSWWLDDRTAEGYVETLAAARTALAEIRRDRRARARAASVLAATAPYNAIRADDVDELTRVIRELEQEADLLPLADGPTQGIDAKPGLAELYIERGRRTASLEDVDRGLRFALDLKAGTTRARLLARAWTERFVLSLAADEFEQAVLAAEGVYSDPAREPDDSFGLFTLYERLEELPGGTRCVDGRDVAELLDGLWSRWAPRADPAAALDYARVASQSLARRYERDGDLRGLERSVEILELQLAAVPEQSRGYGEAVVLAGARWREFYDRTGDPAHVAHAIDRLEAVLDVADPGDPLFLQASGNLGTAYRARFNYLGDLADLDRAISAYERALGGLTANGTNWATTMANLANALRASYDYSGEDDRLDRAISLHEQALAVRPPGHPDRAQSLHNLSTAFFTRYAAKENSEDLNRAIAESTRALAELPQEASMRPDCVSSLGQYYAARYALNADPADLDTAVRLCHEAVSLTTSSVRALRSAQLRLAHALGARHEHGGSRQDIDEAVALYRQMCDAAESVPSEVRISAAWSWVNGAITRRAWQEACDAARAGTRALDDLHRSHLSRGLRTRSIRRFQGFTAAAVYALAKGGDPREAVMALEIGRAVSASEALELGDADVAWLAAHGHADLAERFEAAVQRWRAASGEVLDRSLAGGGEAAYLENMASSADPSEDRIAPAHADRDAELRAARSEIDRLAADIREVSGAADFLRPPGFSDVAAAAMPEPLVYLVPAQIGGAALIVTGEQIEVLDLPALTGSAVEQWVSDLYGAYAIGGRTLNWWTALDSLGRRLWDAVASPVIEALPGGRAAVIPAGKLELLPLNAAWTPDPDAPAGRRYAIDDLALRTAPNARLLAAARARVSRASQSRLLAIEDPQPVGAPALTAAAAEVAAALRYFSEGTVLAGADAVPEEVIARLLTHDVVHFACHGQIAAGSPLDNALILAHDRHLTLRDILRMRLDRAHRPLRLAVLSACETAMAAQDTPDEIISLPSGLLEAAVAGVIASQWRVPDLSAAVLMARFYAEWAGSSTEPATALRAAQRWTRDSTNREKAEYFAPSAAGALPAAAARRLWRPLVVMEPERRGFAHPAHWAGFGYAGG